MAVNPGMCGSSRSGAADGSNVNAPMTEPLNVDLREAVVGVCGTAFYWKDPLRAVFIRAGVPAAMFDRYTELSKFKIARSVLGDLDAQGERGRQVQRKLVVELAGMREPMAGAEDPAAGRAALVKLRELALARRIVVDAEQDRVEERRRRKALEDEARHANAKRMTDLCDRFRALAAAGGDPQRRGYEFEALLRDLFAAHDIPFRASYRTDTGQIDGAIKYDAFDYLLEARWRKEPASANDLFGLAGKVEANLDATRGLFISMVTYRPEVVEQVTRMTKRLILVDGQDMALVFESQMSLTDALDLKVAKAAQEGRIFF
jgi:Restriction endonuclease